MATSGTVKFFNHSRGFGFVSPEDGSKDVFVHATALEAAGIASIDEGDKITFDIEDDPFLDDPEAIYIRGNFATLEQSGNQVKILDRRAGRVGDRAGVVEIEWDASNMASGVYFYRLKAENFTDTKKMVLMK